LAFDFSGIWRIGIEIWFFPTKFNENPVRTPSPFCLLTPFVSDYFKSKIHYIDRNLILPLKRMMENSEN
jgi:hypothetical protein